MTTGSRRPRRRWYTLAAVAASIVAIVFSTVGDGVEVADAAGPRRLVVDLGHQLVWALLAGAFAVAAVRSRWGRVSQTFAVAAGILYLLFLFAVFLWP
ncbi:MAG: hypothetical protein IE924_01770 [Microbacterium sp.]|uniref:hypothetical protein n=1 Tax=Microbacterium sp. TaxID=51671 RepID=UPI001987F45E|nr:hypothetical protein [Microbacterium sp.]MBD3756819.1 hypothetical protein [Microbacterium sp.]